MFLYWTVLALLLLLPQSINSQELSEKEQLDITAKNCDPPKPSVDGKATVLCFQIQFCPTEKGSGGYEYKPIDTRLLLSAIAFLTVEDDGRIKAIYSNFETIYKRWSKLVQDHKGDTISDIIFKIKVPGNAEEATKLLQSATDIIFYMGSDHSDSYDEITYAYNSTFLKMKKGTPITNLYDRAVVSFMDMNLRGPYVLTYNQVHDRNHGPPISSPGIYRFHRNKNDNRGKLTELYYDPLLAGNRYLT